MSRLKKDGVFWNGKIEASVYAELEKYQRQTGLSKTTIVEKALHYYITKAQKIYPLLEEDKEKKDDR